jgi:hypothetical protein
MVQGDMGVPFGGSHLRMAEKFLDDPEVDVPSHQMSCDAVAEKMGIEWYHHVNIIRYEQKRFFLP